MKKTFPVRAIPRKTFLNREKEPQIKEMLAFNITYYPALQNRNILKVLNGN